MEVAEEYMYPEGRSSSGVGVVSFLGLVTWSGLTRRVVIRGWGGYRRECGEVVVSVIVARARKSRCSRSKRVGVVKQIGRVQQDP
eukprot:767753-Hanusia_phi.AAC.1